MLCQYLRILDDRLFNVVLEVAVGLLLDVLRLLDLVPGSRVRVEGPVLADDDAVLVLDSVSGRGEGIVSISRLARCYNNYLKQRISYW